MKELVIFHSLNGTMHCDDGFAAACVASRVMPDAELHPGIYGRDPPDVTGRRVYMLDFSYKRPVMLEMGRKAVELVVIDHHKTAQADLAGLAAELDWNACDVSVTFDMEHSGAILAWDHFVGAAHPPPDLLTRIEDGDLWRFAYQDTKLVQAALRSYPQDFDTWAGLMARPIADLASEGVAIRRFIERKIEELLPNARVEPLAGDGSLPHVTTVNCPPFLASEVAGALAEHADAGWACAYADTASHRVYSLRSRGEGAPDVSEIAKALGGGGHRNAAGFQVPLPVRG